MPWSDPLPSESKRSRQTIGSLVGILHTALAHQPFSRAFVLGAIAMAQSQIIADGCTWGWAWSKTRSHFEQRDAALLEEAIAG